MLTLLAPEHASTLLLSWTHISAHQEQFDSMLIDGCCSACQFACVV